MREIDHNKNIENIFRTLSPATMELAAREGSSLEFKVKFPRFRGHPTICVSGVHNVEETPPYPPEFRQRISDSGAFSGHNRFTLTAEFRDQSLAMRRRELLGSGFQDG